LDWGAATGAATQVAVEGDPALRALSGTPAVVTALREKYVQNRKVIRIPASLRHCVLSC
jgi:hypothetical protein